MTNKFAHLHNWASCYEKLRIRISGSVDTRNIAVLRREPKVYPSSTRDTKTWSNTRSLFSSRLFSASATHYLCRERDSKVVKTIAWSAIERLHHSQEDRGLDALEGQVIKNHTGRMHVNCSPRAFLGHWHILITLYHGQQPENTATLSLQVSYDITP
jgi:hypothetical protein